MQINYNVGVPENDEIVDERINTTALFRPEDKSNFNKGLDPDCFDGNVLNRNEWV